MKVGDTVKVVKCDVCQQVVGKTAVVKTLGDDNTVSLNFGKGRPPKGRPERFSAGDIMEVTG